MAIAVSPDGRSAYVTNTIDDTVSQYDIGPGGTLSPKRPAAVPAGPFPASVAVSPNGRSVYVSDSNDASISQYDVGPRGALSPRHRRPRPPWPLRWGWP